MDPWRIAARILFAYVFVLVLVRITGRRTVRQSDLPSFVVALIIGDMFDDLIWSEVPVAQFVVGLVTLFAVHLLATMARAASGLREWRRRSATD
jgi:uncharacterized membrane protein YcaP (DUF421 family)